MKASLATVAIALLLLGAACSGDDGGGGDDTTTSAPDGTGSTETTAAPAGDLSSYDTVADLNAAITGAGITCNLEYEGLVDDDKEQSLCTIGGSQAFLTIWYDESFVGQIVSPAEGEIPTGVAYGQNWTVETSPPDAATATAVADAAGGASTDG